MSVSVSSGMATPSNIPPAVRDYYFRHLLMTLYPQLIFQKFAVNYVMPYKMGDTAVYRRYIALPSAKVPLSPGITPPGTVPAITDIRVQTQFYGNFAMITDQCELTNQDRVLEQTVRLLAQNMAQTISEICRDVLVSTSSVLECVGGNNSQTPTNISQTDISKATIALRANNAEFISELIEPSVKIGTVGIRPAFFGLTHTYMQYDIEQTPKFKPTGEYPAQQTVLTDEFGSTEYVRWLSSTLGFVSSATPAVYSNIILAKEALGVVHLGPQAGDFYIQPFGSGGSADPLAQRATAGWRHPFASVILSDLLVVNLLSTLAT